MADQTIHINTQSSTGLMTLNRPQVLNALSLDMCGVMKDALMAWAGDEAIDRILITATPGRAFCSGGDVRAIAPMIEADITQGDAYFEEEYGLDMLVAVYPKPIFVIADGLTMGGGAGLLLNASNPVITTAMDFAMPETAIGLFPDVGAARFLRRAPPPMAVMMAMTGWRIGAGDMHASGIAPLCIDHGDAQRAAEAIITAATPDEAAARLGDMGLMPDDTPLLDAMDWLTTRFNGGRFDGGRFNGGRLDEGGAVAIRQGLDGDDHPFAEKVRHALDTRCPLSIHLAHRLMADPALAPPDKASALQQDYRIAKRMIRHPDFIEGVRAVLIDKDNTPRWKPAALTGVTPAMVEAMVTPIGGGRLVCPEAEAVIKQNPVRQNPVRKESCV